MKVIIGGKWELDLTSPPRVGELIATTTGGGRVAEVVWLMPDEHDNEVRVHVQLEKGETATPA
ncbi:hypothetical protein [Streptomyces sp. H27-H5]|uniref:hypothetical protein n=1 Tax=Streptomyces sp. H27-H5 TaxID=2996460 RepID=UPI002272256A|nr:hypothetical protein [Streptomyces sp. H27-H5]MCY0961154.1 hypothetical protein [Streptomyces sp. H27-H5]